MEKNCMNCICIACENRRCFRHFCEGAKPHPAFYKEELIENCHKEKCSGFEEIVT